jgi:hypothetical protein
MIQFLFGWWVLSNQDETNQKLQHANDLQRRANELQQQNNALLEQIRRMQLTPAQRAAEDKRREQLAARREAEAQLALERKHTLYFWMLFGITVLIGLFAIGAALDAHPAAVQSFQAVYAPPSPAPPAESVSTVPTEAEKAANWQRILEMRKAERPTATATPTPDYAPRAELVRRPSNP